MPFRADTPVSAFSQDRKNGRASAAGYSVNLAISMTESQVFQTTKGARIMVEFVVRECFNGRAITFGPGYPSVEIAVSPKGLYVDHGGVYVLTPALSTDREIDTHINERIRELEAVRIEAKKRLGEYRAQAKPAANS
jgi:hypothetical protein